MKTCYSLLLSLLICTSAIAQTEEEMKQWIAYMTPGEVHKMMAGWDGEWNEEITMWMAEGAPEEKMVATCTNKMILGGRYQQASHHGTMMGQPFEGVGMLAWDNGSKTFINSWVDNMSTGMMQLEGTWDAATKTIHFKGTMNDPTTGKPLNIRETLKIVDDNTQELTQYTEKGGKEFKNMFIRMTRKK